MAINVCTESMFLQEHYVKVFSLHGHVWLCELSLTMVINMQRNKACLYNVIGVNIFIYSLQSFGVCFKSQAEKAH